MHHNDTVIRWIPRLTLAATLIVAEACGNSTGLPNGSGRLGFVATNGISANASVVPQTVPGHTLDLTSVALTVTRAELKRSPTAACAGDDEDDDDDRSGSGLRESCGELKIGPTTIDLPVAGNVVTIPANTIPVGTYRELEVRVAEVQLRGTYDGKAFDVAFQVKVKSEIEFSTPLVVSDSAPASITVGVPVEGWLVNADGSLIDPNTIAASPTLTTQITDRIRASLRAFEDRDHDGHDDRGGRGGRD